MSSKRKHSEINFDEFEDIDWLFKDDNSIWVGNDNSRIKGNIFSVFLTFYTFQKSLCLTQSFKVI